jgi:hypothetical protein
MLSSVLRSACAVEVNFAIMRAFVRLREMLLSNADLARKLAELEANTIPSSRRFSTPSARSWRCRLRRPNRKSASTSKRTPSLIASGNEESLGHQGAERVE